MKLTRLSIVSLLLICSVFTASSFMQAQTNLSPRLAEARELNAKVLKLYGENKYAEALPLALRALDLCVAELGPDDRNLIPLLLNLGDLYQATLKPKESRAHYERALRITESVFGAEA